MITPAFYSRSRCCSQLMARQQYVSGLGLLLIVVLIWTVSSFVVQDILSESGARAFFITYFANSLFMLQLPIVFTWRYFRKVPVTASTPLDYTSLDNASSRRNCRNIIYGMYDWPTLRAALIVCPLWFAANGLYNLSLAHTSVTSNTIISATSGMFTFAFAVRAGSEQFSWWKIIGVVCSMGGTFLTALADSARVFRAPVSALSPSSSSSSSHSTMITNSLVGDIICLFAAVFYGMYTTAIHTHLPSVDKTSLFFGYLGTIGFACCTPIVLILNATKIEDLSLVSSRALVLIAAKGLFDNVFSDALWAIAMKWTSPTVATLGLALTIPFSIVGAMLLGDGLPTPVATFGALVMLVGFFCVNIPGGSEEKDDGGDDDMESIVTPEEHSVDDL